MLRAILVLAVYTSGLADDNGEKCHPHIMPENAYFYCYAGDAGGILREFSIGRVSSTLLAIPHW